MIKMLKLKVIVVVIFVSFTIFSCSQKEVKKEFLISQSNSREASIFRQNCAICHGEEGLGKMVAGKLVPSLRSGNALQKSEEEMFLQMYNGGNGMLPFKNQLKEEEIRNMAKFVKEKLQGRE